MGIARRAGVTIDMARTLGWRPAIEQLVLTGREWFDQGRRRRAFRRLNLTTPQERAILGSRLVLDPMKPGIDRNLLLNGIHEPIATGHLMHILRPEDVVLEAGSNIGYYALIESRLCRAVHAAEPHPENFTRLVEHARLNGRDNIHPHQVAFGPEEGELALRVSPLSNWHSCLGTKKDEQGVITVPARTIDSFTAEHGQPTIMRMDIEGFEVEALKGAASTLRGIRALFIEIHGPRLTRAQVCATLDLIEAAGLKPDVFVQQDWPGLARVLPADRIDRLRAGDRCTYEAFFTR